MNGTHAEVTHRNFEAINAKIRKEEASQGKTPYTSAQSKQHSSSHRQYVSSSSVLNSPETHLKKQPSFAERREALRKFRDKSLATETPAKKVYIH